MQAIRFGDARSRQSKIQDRRTAQSGSGRRRGDTSIHATSRPWHTSTPGIRMNVSTLGQIASRDPTAAKYLNRMNLSEQAQKKRGIAESEEGRGYDKMGKAIKRGTQAAVSGRRAYGAPNQDTIDNWQAQISGREREAKRVSGVGAAEEALRARTALGGGGMAAALPALQRAVDTAKAGNDYQRQIGHIRGLKRDAPKGPFTVRHGRHKIYR